MKIMLQRLKPDVLHQSLIYLPCRIGLTCLEGLVVNGATRNAQQTIYRLYFGVFGTPFTTKPVRRKGTII